MPFEDLKKRISAAKDIITQPGEFDIDDPSYLPNQQLAGQGLANAIAASGALMPEQKPIKVKSITGEDLDIPAIDPSGLMGMGILKTDKEVAKAINKLIKLKKNPTRHDILKAVEYKTPTSIEEFKQNHTAVDKALEYAAKRRLGKEGREMSEELAQDIQDTLHPYLSKTKLPVIHDSQLSKEGMRGVFKYQEHPDFAKIQKAKEIRLQNPLDVAVSEHEIGHYLDSLFKPEVKTNPVSTIENVLGNPYENALDAYSKRHHASVPGHFELDRATELLQDKSLSLPGNVVDQHRLQKQIFDNLINEDLKDPKKAYNLLKQQQEKFSTLKSKLSEKLPEDKIQEELKRIKEQFGSSNVEGQITNEPHLSPMDVEELLKQNK